MSIRERENIDEKEIERWIKQKIDVECNIINWRKSGPVIIAKMESEGKKAEIMRNKYKLRGEKIFIENDLSWEERKIQEQINKWVRERRAKGEEVKAGWDKVKVRGKWINWAIFRQEEANEEIKRKEIIRREEGQEVENVQNFVM